MIDGLLTGLVLAWILSFFGVDEIFVGAIQPFIDKITTVHYYFLFAVLGAICRAIEKV